MPDFDAETYPFFLTAGMNEIWIGNLSTNKVQTLIKAGPSPNFDQPGALFLPSVHPADKKNVRVVFSSSHNTYANMKVYEIHEMTFHEDFKNVLIDLGYLPTVTVKEVVDISKENKAISKENKALKEALKA